jgi:hypothetical protein
MVAIDEAAIEGFLLLGRPTTSLPQRGRGVGEEEDRPGIDRA